MLVNMLRAIRTEISFGDKNVDAYKLQSEGMNTYEANNHLGFGDDLRDFSEAAYMLKALGLTEIRLVTNNPKKIRELSENGINIVGN